MLELIIPAYDLFNDELQEFISGSETRILLEHSLVSISKWESKWEKPFMTSNTKTDVEVLDYIKCMTLNDDVPDSAYMFIDNKQYEAINKYISSPMTATTITDTSTKRSKEIMTSEVLYYYMIACNIPMECEKWHINRLMTLIQVCNVKNDTGKKRPVNEVLKSNAELNAERKRKMNTKG